MNLFCKNCKHWVTNHPTEMKGTCRSVQVVADYLHPSKTENPAFMSHSEARIRADDTRVGLDLLTGAYFFCNRHSEYDHAFVCETKEDIVRGNKIIATYMGQRDTEGYYVVEQHPYPVAFSAWPDEEDGIYHAKNLLYHYKWNWLEDAIGFIQKENPGFTVAGEEEIVSVIEAFEKVVTYILNTGNAVSPNAEK